MGGEKKNVTERLREAWDGLKPHHKRKISMFVLVLVVVVVGVLGYAVRESSRKNRRLKREKVSEIKLSPQLLEKSFVLDTKKKVNSLQKEISSLRKQLEKLEREKTASSRPAVRKEGEKKASPSFKKLPPPPPPPASGRPAAVKPLLPPEEVIKKEVVGDIAAVEVKAGKEKKKVSKKNSVYLPPSFMEATLLSGLYAPTMEGAEKHPVPVLIRVKDLAVLPNEVKADLKGCFIIGEGYGSLADERVKVRLVTLSCIAKNGKSIIDQKVKGFLVDQDGKVGLKGRVVTKMGAFLARQLLAGFLEGFGSAYEESAYDTSVSALGEVRTLNPGEAFKSGVGKGVSKTARSLAKLYAEMARQTFPVIEVGALRNVTVVISQGVELKLKNYRVKMNGGEDLWGI